VSNFHKLKEVWWCGGVVVSIRKEGKVEEKEDDFNHNSYHHTSPPHLHFTTTPSISILRKTT
jgi:hypothetical protein